MQRVAAFTVAGVMLVILADFPTTSPLAVAFAWLIFLSTLYLVGPVAMERVQAFITPKSAPASIGGTSGGGTF